MSAIPKGSLILVTGGTGYIGSHVVDQSLKAGLRVRAAVRSADKGELVKEFFDKKYPGQVEYVVVADMGSDDAYVEAIKGVVGVLHVAAVLPRAGATYDDVVPPSVDGTISILKAAASEPSVKRVVVTSSSAVAALNTAGGPVQHLDSTTWNEGVKATKEEANPMVLYVYGKILAERAAWDFVKNEKPSFVLNTILPNCNFGRIFPGFGPSSGGFVTDLAKGELTIKMIPPQWFVDVADTALIHVVVLLDPSVANERIWAVSQPYSYNDVVRAILKAKPDAPITEETFGAEGELQPNTTIDFERTKALLKPYGGLKTLETSVREALEG